MPIVLALIAAVVGAYFWMNRARNAVTVASDLADMATDVLGAARRFGFRRQANIHPVESIDDPDLAAGALAYAFMELGSLPSQEQQQALAASLGRHLGRTTSQAEEILILGRWLTSECGGPQPAMTRLVRRLYKLSGTDRLNSTLAILNDVASSGHGGTLSDRQKDALAEVSRAFRIS